MLGGLFLASKAQNLFIDVGNNSQQYIKGGRLTFTGSSPSATYPDINIAKSTFNLGPSGGYAPKPLPYFAIHEIYGVASGGGGGGSSGFYFNENGEGGRAGSPYSVLVKLFSPAMSSQWAITNEGGNAGANIPTSTNGGNGRTVFTPGFLFSAKTPVVVGLGGRKWGYGLTLNALGEVSSSPPFGNGGNGGLASNAEPQAGNAGSVLCRGMVW